MIRAIFIMPVEAVLGKIINKNNLRDKVYIADKLPAFLVKKPEQIETYYNTQLERLDMDYIDYYLMHMLDSYSSWETLKEFVFLEFIEEKKAKGEIRHIGFSFQGRPEEFIKIIKDSDWDFCQIQLNYLEAKAPNKVKKGLKPIKYSASPSDWGLRWIRNHKEVSVVLSGMMGMGVANSGADQCTGCGKCEQHCPQQIAIREELDNRVMRSRGLEETDRRKLMHRYRINQYRPIH